jgi:aspartate aminotransferase-like enzyme/GNAT superfamily N-acetyltransferase
MITRPPLRFRIATEPAEFEQIHALNYRTFVDEIPQHAANAERRLIDRFDAQNTYAVCMRGERLVGMISACGVRPFSLDHKLPDLDAYLPAAPGARPRVCEVRLLAVEPEHRTGVVFRGLGATLAQHCLGEGYDVAVISGTVRQLKLYRHIGFVPFGPLVGSSEAQYQPMYLTLEQFSANGSAFMRRRPVTMSSHVTMPAVTASPAAMTAPACFLPGPVQTSAAVRRAFEAPPVSHRTGAFADHVDDVRASLCALTGARYVQLPLGSGTLANDIIAAQLSLRHGCGLVLSNGEFGERLADHAARWALSHSVLRKAWGAAFTRADVERALDALPAARWLWAVHCETSTGVLNDIDMLRGVCAARGVALCLDCISSIGTVPVDLRGVALAAGSSGKGIGSLPGVALVFHDDVVTPERRLPRYLDLGLYAAGGDAVPFTHSSNLIAALHAALADGATRPAERFASTARDGARLRGRLRDAGFTVLADDATTSPAVTTIVLPAGTRAAEAGDRMEQLGFLIGCRSAYLRERNWVQVCLMGSYPADRLDALPAALAAAILSP